jgi:hypothetical protein
VCLGLSWEPILLPDLPRETQKCKSTKGKALNAPNLFSACTSTLHRRPLILRASLSLGPLKPYTKARFTLGVRADVQLKSSFPIGAKVEISPKGFTLGVKAEIQNWLPKLDGTLFFSLGANTRPHSSTFISNLGGQTTSQKCSKLAPRFQGLDS